MLLGSVGDITVGRKGRVTGVMKGIQLRFEEGCCGDGMWG